MQKTKTARIISWDVLHFRSASWKITTSAEASSGPGPVQDQYKSHRSRSLSHPLHSPSSPSEASELEALSDTGAWGCHPWEGKRGEGLAWRGAEFGLRGHLGSC